MNIVKTNFFNLLLLVFSMNVFANQGSTIATVEPTLMNQIQSDYNGAINGSVIPKIGDTMNWAKGTLIRTGANQLRYVNNNNGHYEVELTPSTDLTQLAKEKPWIFSFGIGAYKENGKIILYNQDGPISYNDLLKTNEYKALTGANVIHEKVAVNEAAKEVVKRSVANIDQKIENADYIKEVKDSSIEMLITASAKYKSGIISKDQYIQIALQVSQTAEYYNKNKKLPEADSSKKTSLVG